MLVASLARPRWPSTPRTRVLLCDWVVLCLVKSRVGGLIEREGRLSHERVRRDIAHHDVIERMIPNLMSAILVHEFGHARAYRTAQEMQLSDKSIDNQATLAVVVLMPVETMSRSTFGAAAPQELTSRVLYMYRLPDWSSMQYVEASHTGRMSHSPAEEWRLQKSKVPRSTAWVYM